MSLLVLDNLLRIVDPLRHDFNDPGSLLAASVGLDVHVLSDLVGGAYGTIEVL